MPSVKGTSRLRDPGSFKDPSGYVFLDSDKVYRTVNPIAAEKFQRVLVTGVIDFLVKNNLLIATKLLAADSIDLASLSGARGEEPAFVLEHPKIHFISYPYEWTFSQLKDAALNHLELHLACLRHDVDLSDASPYNMQFFDGNLLHIDVLSLHPYEEGRPWAAYNQFCRMFLAPLLLEAWAGIPFQPMLKGRLEGFELSELQRLLPKTKLFSSLNGLLHIVLQARVSTSINSSTRSSNRIVNLPKSRFITLLTEMKSWIGSLDSGRRNTSYWKNYAAENSYLTLMREQKKTFVANWSNNVKEGTIWDIGGNSGEYSQAAIAGGVSNAIVMDSDLDSLELCYREYKNRKNCTLPILMNIADPSPSLGWNQRERKGLAERGNPQGILALAVIHHLVIKANLPLTEVIDWFISIAPTGIIEFVPKSDPMVQQMLSNREDIWPDYTEGNFLRILRAKADILDFFKFDSNQRLLISYRIRNL
jgi:hypothetical protein